MPGPGMTVSLSLQVISPQMWNCLPAWGLCWEGA